MFSHISQANLYIALPAVIFVLFLLQKLRNYRLAYSNGCKPCPHYPHRDPFGFDYMIQNARAFKEAKYLPKLLDAFDQFGHTWQRNVIGTPVIATMDPVNIQAVLIAKDEHWGVEAERNVMWRPLFGKESVFTNDGHIWGYSRNLIKPAINATEYKNFDKFEHHFQSLLQLLPKEDGQAFNMGHVLEVFVSSHDNHGYTQDSHHHTDITYRWPPSASTTSSVPPLTAFPSSTTTPPSVSFAPLTKALSK